MKIIAEGECWSQKWSQDGADTESVSVSIRPAVLLCLFPFILTQEKEKIKEEITKKPYLMVQLNHTWGGFCYSCTIP